MRINVDPGIQARKRMLNLQTFLFLLSGVLAQLKYYDYDIAWGWVLAPICLLPVSIVTIVITTWWILR